MKAENLPFADSEFEVATAIEVWSTSRTEHTVSEMARIASSTCSSACRARSRCGVG